jgi:amino acid adenylation domain-containing protein
VSSEEGQSNTGRAEVNINQPSRPAGTASPSPLQRRLWFLEQLDPAGVSYVTPYALRLRGMLDERALTGALAELFASRPALRARPADAGGIPSIVDANAVRPRLDRVTLDGQHALDQFGHDLVRRHAGWAAEGALTATLATLGPDDHVLFLLVHQSFGGAGDVAGLAAELGELYAGAASAEVLSASAEAPTPGTEHAARIAVIPAMAAPVQLTRPPVWQPAAEAVPIAVPSVFGVFLDRSPNRAATALAAVHVLLARHSGRWDGVVGLRAGAATVPVALELSGEQTFESAVLDSGRELAAAAGSDAEQLAAQLATGTDLSRNPLFDVLVELADAAPPRFGPLEAHPVFVRTRVTRNDLTLRLYRRAEGDYVGELEYPTSLFTQAGAERIAARFTRLAEHIAAAPHTPLEELELLPHNELAAVAPAISARTMPDTPVHELIAEQARRTPDAIAVECGEVKLSYADLLAQSTALAVHLRDLGCRTGDLIGVALPRGVDLVVALLGTLKAGAAYVPLDPNHPADRLGHILDDAGVGFLISADTVRDGLPANTGHLVRLADVPADGAGELPQVRRGDLAYVIYTSGSTGRPKGVMVPHGALTNFLWSMRERPGIEPGTVFPAVTTVSFDIAALELFLPLVEGASVAIAERNEARDPDRLAALLARVGATAMQATPVTWRILLDSGWTPPAGFTALCGGEKLSPELAARLCRSGVRLWDLYGPTETTVWSSVAALDGENGEVVDFAPVANTLLAVLDEQLRPVPLGSTGELYIGGTGVAIGYLNRPALTAERFLPDPYSDEPGARLYRTGDLARRHEDGRIEILGRTDDQIKIRGFRVEPGEIESVLAGHPDVRAAVVRTVTGPGGDLRLVGYVCPVPGSPAPSSTKLYAYCARTVPDYMIPAQFVTVETFPTTPNGKIDRKALPVPAAATPRPAVGRAPRTPAEQVVAKVLAEVLGISSIGTDDDFFALGGHSLLATRAMSRLRAEFDVDLSVTALFEARTVAGLAVRLAAASGSVPPVTPTPRTEPLPLSFAQQRLWFLDQLDPGGTEYLEPFALRLRGELDLDALNAALTQVIERHEILRTRYQAGANGEPVQIVDPAVPLTIGSIVDADPRQVLDEELAKPFDLATDTPVRVRLVRTAPQDHTLLMVLHHIATDDRSLEVLTDELEAAYADQPLPPPSVQYADYASWQRRRLSGELLAEKLTFWREQLAGLEPTELPADRPRPSVRDPRGATLRFTIPAPLAERLTELGRSQEATPFMTYLAGFFALLSQYTARDDVAVGVPVAGRNRPEIDNLVGFFVNTVVLRADMSGQPSFAELLGQVRDTALPAYTHDELPFDLLVEDLAPQRDLSRNPLFGVLFAMHGQPRTPRTFERPELDADIRGAKFDLGCHLTERADGGLDGRIEYAVALFDDSTIERFVAHYLRLLEAVGAQPDIPVATVALHKQSELDSLVLKGGPAGAVGTVLELIAAADPRAVAVRDPIRTLTFAQLQSETNRLAHRLRELGAQRGEYVLVRLPRTADLVIALLAVLKTGAAYVPLDPDHPAERLAIATEDTGARILVGNGSAPHVLNLNDPSIARQPDNDLDDAPHPGDLAYVVYTSGSTGRPKGAMVTHGGLACYTRWGREQLGPDGGAPLHSSIAYDLALTALYPPLAAGATVTMVEGAEGVDALAESLTRPEPFGLLKLTPTHLDLLARTLPSDELARAARCLVVAGEQLRGERLAAWTEHAPNTRVVNSYGPSEAAIACCAYITTAGEIEPGPVPIGVPLPGVTLHVLDDAMGPVPTGVPGELYIGGRGVGHGYLGRPALTAERFLPDPYADEPGARLYRTGDLVRRRADGNLEFLDRIDQQVKISGFRVEPGEIEAVLTEHTAVRAAAVIAVEYGEDDRRLAAYVVAEDNTNLTELRAHVADRLPQHMVPALWTTVDDLPKLGNGKLDRRALPKPAGGAAATEFVAARTPAERTLAEVWAEVLGVERVGMYDDFFDLGGQSLLATRVIAKLRDRFPIALSVRDLFTARTVAGFAELVASRGTSHAAKIRPTPRSAPLPLSFAQRRLWFLDQLNPGGLDYLMLTALRIRGRLDVPALAEALSTVIRRHEVLRTRYVADASGEPVQVVDPAAPVKLAAQDGDPEQVVAEELATPVDLATGPVLRARLVRVGAEEHVLVLVIHHIAADGWSTSVLAAELETAYRGQALPDLPVQYGDFAVWQREQLSDGGLEDDLVFWRKELAGLEPTELPTDRPRPPVRDPRGSTVSFSVPAALAGRLDELGRAEGATPFMTYLAGFFALLARYTGKTDLAVGTPISGRGRPEVDGLIGFFVNTVVLRADLTGAPDFRALLGKVAATAVEAYAHDEVPFERLVEDLAPQRDLSRNPLFGILFALRDAGEEQFTLGDLDVSPEPAPWLTSKFDMILELTRRADGGYDGTVEFATALFDQETAQRIAAHYVRLLHGAAQSPESTVDHLDVLSEDEKRALVHDWNDTAVPRAECVPERIAAQAARTPDALAVDSEQEQLSYAELDARVAKLANQLTEFGIGQEDVVAVCLPRRVDLLVAILAVNRAGAAYLPLDPDHPADRQAYMLADSAAKIVIADVEPVPGIPLLRPDDERIAAQPATTPPVHTDPDTLAYVIYTSGSTGKPKGVALPHHGIANQIKWKTEGVGIQPDDRVLMKTQITFDAVGWEMFAPLVLGATVVIAPPGVERDPAAMVDTIARQRASVLQVVPSFLRPLVDEPRIGECTSLRMIYSAGEALPAEVGQRLHESLPGTLLINGYGPTEASIEVTSWTYREGDSGIVPIGRPGFNTRMAVLDDADDLVPIGVPGQLHIAGESLARGYLNKPALTAAAFVPDPYGPPGSRMYRTGDLSFWRADGALEFLGRLDHQVKIRGVRVELGEVEAVLAEHPGVAAAVVTTPPGPDGQPWLVAYLVGNGTLPRDAELRAHLLATLPEPYVPSVFVELTELPFAPSGKVDRNALPKPDLSANRRELVPLTTPNEKLVAGVLAEVLGMDAVGAADDFFELGGHSLLAGRVISRLRALTGAELGVRAIFEDRTVTALASRLDTLGTVGSASILPVEHAGPLPLSFAQQRLWFLDQLSPGSTEYHMTWALRLTGRLDVEALGGAVSELLARHDVLRTRYPTGADGEPVQLVEPAWPVSLPVIDLTVPNGHHGDAEQRLHAAVDSFAGRPFDLAAEVPVRPGLIRAGEQDHVFVLVLHHIAGDAWSEGVLTRELQELYLAGVEGRAAQLDPPALRYADYAVWQRDRLSGDLLENELAHWRERLADLPPLELPTDRPRPAVRDGRGATVEFHLPAEIAQPLLAEGRRRGATAFMTFLGVFSALVSRYTGATDLAIGTPVAGRGRAELENLAGFFVNTVVLRTDTAGDPTLGELIDRVRHTALDAFGHDEVPFERLVEELAPQRDLARTPLFDVMFEVREAPEDRLTLPGLEVSRIEVARTRSKFELTLALTAQDDGGYQAELEYATALFDQSTMERLAGHFRTLVESGAASPSARISSLELLTPAEHILLLDEWSGAQTGGDTAECVAEAFFAQAAATPDAIAIADGSEHISYADLAARVTALAKRLRVAGVGLESPVGVYLERSASAVIVLLAVLRAGGAYVPLDPAQPAERLALVLDDLAAPVLVTESRLRDRLGAVRETVFVLDGELPETPETELPQGDPDRTAYIIFTSGSTGRPKGVLVPHRAYAHHCRAIAAEYDIRQGDRVMLLAALTFDVAMDQIAAPLLAGATVVIGARERFWAPEELPDRLAETGVTHLEITPAYYREVVASVRAGDDRLARLRLMNVGSDVVTHGDAELWAATGLPARFLSTYGPTEATVTCLTYPVTAADLSGDRPESALPIGRPVPGTRAYVLDGHGNPVPVGVPGELYLGGLRLSNGYLRGARLTADRFVPDPFGAEPGARLYRTGDLVRYRTDGAIEFLGRIDTQVKVRGFRIELGEIEAALTTHPAVRAAAVSAPELGAGDRRLVGYVVPAVGASADGGQLRAFLRDLLPDYMIPGLWVSLDELPLTASKKVDRRALPLPELADAGAGVEHVPPRTEVEAAIAEIWQEVLGRPGLGVADDFFDLGGHSLLATRVMSRLADLFDLDVPLRLLFEATTVAAQAAALEELAEAQVAHADS